MTWLQSHLHTYLNWHPQLNLHDSSQSALAAAVVVLGLVILLELRSVMQLRQVVDRSLARVFEQLDLLRFENQQLLEGQARLDSAAPAPISATPDTGLVRVPEQASAAPAADATPLVTGRLGAQIAERNGLSSGEARLLASLAEARARRQSGPIAAS